MSGVRALLVLAGLGLGGYGVLLLAETGFDNVRAAAVWLVGGVVVHDAVLAPLTLAVVALLTKVRGRRLPAPVVVGTVVLSTVTIVAVPVLGRFGARPDNATLLDRPYGLGWVVVAVLVAVGVGLGLVAGRRRPVPERDA